ncbi:MAG: GntR family transcriptional regulator [Eubacteriales bacterium]|nr:GntR family transcriptional regulator [Eubacteriales bacterium]
MFQIDRFGRQPIYEQIIEQTEQLIATGALRPDDQLPSVRALSQTLSINPNTLQKAYSELERRGITTGVPGSGRFISKNAPRLVGESMEALLQEISKLCEKLHLAGIPEHSVTRVVAAVYAKPLTNKNGIKTNDAPDSASGKDAEQ